MSDEIVVTTGARLHFGFFTHRPCAGRTSERFDLDATGPLLGRSNYGGIGLMIDSPGVVIRAARSDRAVDTSAASVESSPTAQPLAQRITQLIAQFRRASAADRQPPPCSIEICRDIPSHCGLGSGTQLALAVAQALALLSGDGLAGVSTLARRMGRGRRSAIGIHGFGRGGFLVDGGKIADEEIGRQVARAEVPDAWRFLLVTPSDDGAEGLSGQEEIGALEQLPGMSRALTERLCRLVLLEMLPALADADAERFGEALTEYGQSVGNYFKPVQGGEYANPQMAELAHWLRSAGIRGVAQTSWGPTLAVCCADAERAQALNDRLQSDARWNRCPTRIVGPLNTGAAIQL